MQNLQQNRLFPEKGPERLRDSILAFLLSVCGSLFIGDQEIFQSDVLYISAVVQDLFSGLSLLTWNFTPAPYFFPDLTFYSLFYSVLDHSLSLRLYGIVQSGFVAFSLMRLFSPPGKRYGIFRLLFSLQFLALIYYQDFYAFLYLPGMHCSSFLFTLILFHRIRHEELLPWKGLYIILMALVLVSDRLFAVQAIFPTLISLLYANRLRKKNPDYGRRVPRMRVQYWIKVVGLALLLGIVLSLLVTFTLNTGRTVSISVGKSFLAFVGDIKKGFGFPLLFYFQCMMLIVFSSFLLHRVLLATETEIRRWDRPSLVFYGRISSSNLLFFIWLPVMAALITGAYVDAYSIRYFAGSFIVSNAGILSIACSLGNRPSAHLSRFIGPISMAFRRSGPIVLAALILVFLISDRFFSKESNLQAEIPSTTWPYHYPDYVQCLDALEPSPAVIMADYWHSKSIYLFSRNKVISYHADYRTGQPSNVISNASWWENRWPPQAVYMANLSPELIKGALGQPDRIIKCQSVLETSPGAITGPFQLAPVWIYSH